MKKRYLSLFLILILITSTASAAIPYKQSLIINNYKIKQVECSNNYLRVLVESKTSSTLKLAFTIHTTNKETNKIFTDQLLKSFESNFFLITTNKQCNEIKRLEVNGYISLDNQNIVYLNSESSYKFTGKESSITTITEQITSTETTQTTQQITPTKYSYVYLNNKLLERINLDNNDVNYFHQDHLGSNRVITDNNGNVLSKNDYTPFGNELSFSSKSNYKFTGKELDKNNLYYFGARYYDSSIGRFTSTDPIFNPLESSYSYARNNPIAYIDPSGNEPSNAIRNWNIGVSTALPLLTGIWRRDSIIDIAKNTAIGMLTGELSYRLKEYVGNQARPGTDFLLAGLADQVVSSVRSSAISNKQALSEIQIRYLMFDIGINKGNIEPGINIGRLNDVMAMGRIGGGKLDLGYSLKTGVPTFVYEHIPGEDIKGFIGAFGGSIGYIDSEQMYLGRPFNDFIRRHEYIHTSLEWPEMAAIGRSFGLRGSSNQKFLGMKITGLDDVIGLGLGLGAPWVGTAILNKNFNLRDLHSSEWYEIESNTLSTKK